MILAAACICSAWTLGFVFFYAQRALKIGYWILAALPAVVVYLNGYSWTIIILTLAAVWHGRRIRICGVTGTIASGKSTFARALARQGAYVIDADEIGRRVLQRDSPAFREVVARFGADAVVDAATGDIDRPRLRALILSDAAARRFVNGATHMRIAQGIFNKVVQQRWIRGRVVVLDAPLLFETGGIALRLLCCPIVVVAASRETQLRRITSRDGVSRASAEASIAAQMTQEEKVSRADIVVRNDDDDSRRLDAAAASIYRTLSGLL